MAHGTFYATEQISKNQALTPEGFLCISDVPIARTGMMLYGPEETPLESGPDGLVKIFRDEEEVFRPETLASINGKPVTNEHPENDVTPESWRELTHGIVLNVRRGLGAMDDLLLADFLITTPEGIEAVQNGRREISLGYEADYDETEPGIGKQSNILINHVALVDQGRCGPRCSIRDKIEVKPMASKQTRSKRIYDALLRAFKAKDMDEVEKMAQDMEGEEEYPETGGGDTHVHIHNGQMAEEADKPKDEEYDIEEYMKSNAADHAEFRARLDALEAMMKVEEEEEQNSEQMMDEFPDDIDEKEAMKAQDSRYLSDSFRDTVAQAEILVPGIKIPVFDSKSKPSISFKKICGFRRQALDLAYNKPETRGTLDELLNGKRLDTTRMTCDAIRTLFRSASALQKTINNSSRDRTAQPSTNNNAMPITLAEINKRNAQRYGV